MLRELRVRNLRLPLRTCLSLILNHTQISSFPPFAVLRFVHITFRAFTSQEFVERICRSNMAKQLLTSAILPLLALATVLTPRQDCSADFKICNPPGATQNTLGPIGPSWDSLYNDIVDVVNGYTIDDAPATTSVDPNGPARRDMAFCCNYVVFTCDVC